MKKVSFYFDFLSPYSYLAWNWVREKHTNSVEFEFIPVILGQVIHFHETKGPAEITSKREYLFKDCLRYAKVNNISFKTPKNLPFNSLYALRASIFSNAKDDQFKVIDSIYNAGWRDGKDIGDPEVLKDVLIEAGLNSDKLMEGVFDKEVRKELKMNVKKANSLNLFGLPSFIVEDELFWGNDSTKYLELYLNGEDPLNVDQFNEFKATHFID
jgi:2-hydroxychromene-2-carboxylate isomerase